MSRIIFFVVFIFSCWFTVAGQTSRFVQLDGIRTHYLEWGKGRETIILLHSLSDSAEIWKDFAPRLAQNYRVIALDRRGAGKTEKTISGYETVNLAKDVVNLIDSLKLGKVHIIGHSFGGNIAATLTANWEEKVSSLVLIEGGFWEKRKRSATPECPAPVENDCLISNAINRGMSEYDAESLYPKITAPTLLILGVPPSLTKAELNVEEKENKKLFDQAVSHIKTVSQQKLKNGGFILITNAQHWVFVDQPETTAAALLKFYKTNERKITK